MAIKMLPSNSEVMINLYLYGPVILWTPATCHSSSTLVTIGGLLKYASPELISLMHSETW
jgi:hypothetical protein